MSSLSGSPGLSDVCATVLLPSSWSVSKTEHCPGFKRKHRCSWACLLCFVGLRWHLLLRGGQLDTRLCELDEVLCLLPLDHQKGTGVCKWRTRDIRSSTWSAAGHLRGISFDFDALRPDNSQQKPLGGGRYLQSGGSEQLRFSTQCCVRNS